MNIVAILKNDFLRLLDKKNYLLIMLVITILIITLAVFFSSKAEIKGNIAFVTKTNHALKKSSSHININYLKSVPKLSELVMNRYDAIVYDKGKLGYDIYTIKNYEFKKMLLLELTKGSDKGNEGKPERGVGTNILGYLIMIIMLQGATYMILFAEDREKGTLKRILTSPVSVSKYLISKGVMNFLFIFIPTISVIFVCKGVLKVDTGFGYGEYLGLLTMITGLSTTFALFMGALFKTSDNAIMATSSIVALTSILAGSFGKVGNNKIFSTIINILPQKNYLEIVKAIEHGFSINGYIHQLLYFILAFLAFISAGIFITKKQYS